MKCLWDNKEFKDSRYSPFCSQACAASQACAIYEVEEYCQKHECWTNRVDGEAYYMCSGKFEEDREKGLNQEECGFGCFED